MISLWRPISQTSKHLLLILIRVIVYTGTPGKECVANVPQSLVEGMNKFLAILGITFRRDPYNHRPRINKLDS